MLVGRLPVVCGLLVQSELRRAVANTRRGKDASAQQQREILKKVEALEALDSTPNPATSDLLSGRWSLLYTGKQYTEVTAVQL